MYFTATWQYLSDWSLCFLTSSNIKAQNKTQSCVNADNTTADGLCAGEPETNTKFCSKLNVNCIYGPSSVGLVIWNYGDNNVTPGPSISNYSKQSAIKNCSIVFRLTYPTI